MKYAAAFVKKVCQAAYSADIIHNTGVFLITGGAGRKQKENRRETVRQGWKTAYFTICSPKTGKWGYNEREIKREDDYYGKNCPDC